MPLSGIQSTAPRVFHASAVLFFRRHLTASTAALLLAGLFVTLIRFDEVYVVYFKTNKRCIREYPNLFNYVKEVYQMPGAAAMD